MQKKAILYLVVFICILSFIGCSNMNNSEQKEISGENYSLSIPNDNLNLSKSEETTVESELDDSNNIISNSEISILLNDIKESFESSGDESKFSEEERKKKYEQFVNSFLRLLDRRESTKLSEDLLSNTLNNSIEFINKNITYINQNYHLRLVSFSGATSIVSRRNETWTFLQWWTEDTVKSQMIFEGSGIRIDDFFLQVVNDKLALLMIGYSGKMPFAQCLVLNEGKWNELYAFKTLKIDKEISDDGWEFTINESNMTVEKRRKDNPKKWTIPSIEINKGNNGFSVLSEDENLKVEFVLSNGQIIVSE